MKKKTSKAKYIVKTLKQLLYVAQWRMRACLLHFAANQFTQFRLGVSGCECCLVNKEKTSRSNIDSNLDLELSMNTKNRVPLHFESIFNRNEYLSLFKWRTHRQSQLFQSAKGRKPFHRSYPCDCRGIFNRNKNRKTTIRYIVSHMQRLI